MKDKITIQQLLDLASDVEEEYDRIRELQSKLKEIFELDFRYEFFCMHGDSAVKLPSATKKEKKEKPKNLSEALDGSFKKIRNALARELHPDLNKDRDTEEEFKDIQKAFEEGNLTKLMSAAEEHEIEVEVTNKDLSAIYMVIDAQREYIEKVKCSLEWSWALCSRKNEEREKVWPIINLERDKFIDYINQNNVSLEVIEAQVLARRKIDWPIIENLLSKKGKKQKSRRENTDAPVLFLL